LEGLGLLGCLVLTAATWASWVSAAASFGHHLRTGG
jgi:hypothetical protein